MNFVIWPLCPRENSTCFSNCRQESKQNKSEIEKERTQLFCAIFFILAFIKHVYQQIWRVSHVFHSFLHQIKRILLFKINHQWWQWYRRFGQCWPQYLTASKGKQREKDENSEFFDDFLFQLQKLLLQSAVPDGEHRLQSAYCLWYSRKSSGKSHQANFDQNLQLIGSFSTCEQFWKLFSHLVRPGDLNSHSDFHLFKKGIKPLWEVRQMIFNFFCLLNI